MDSLECNKKKVVQYFTKSTLAAWMRWHKRALYELEIELEEDEEDEDAD